MKKIILTAIMMAFVLTSCNQKSKEAEKNNSINTEETSELYACPMHPEVQGKKGDKCSKCGMELTVPVKQAEVSDEKVKTETILATTDPSSFSINEIVSNYLKLKNSLVKDDSKGAANAGKTLYDTFNSVNANTVDAKSKKEYLEIVDDAKEHAEHIGDNAGKLDHQREHFASLSKDISDLITLLGSDQKLYQDYCPMYDGGKGAVWISKTKEIENPYFGKKMSTCGSIKKEF